MPVPAGQTGVRRGSDRGRPGSTGRPYGTNDEVVAGRRFVLIIDQESFIAGREQLFRGAVDGLLAQLTPADRAMVAALPFGGMIASFTSDTARIRLALGRVTGQGARSETGSDLACRTRRFLESLEGLLRNTGPRTSPQTLILFTAGLAAPRRDAPMGLMPGMCELLVDQFRSLASAAATARANVYVMQPADVGIRTSLPRPTIGGVGDLGSDNPNEGIEHLAGVTGGARLPLDAAGTASLLRVARESSAYYVAELEPVKGEVFGRSRNLSVRVTRRGVTIRVRPEIAFIETARAATARLTVGDILASTEAVTDLALRVGGFTVRDPDGKLRVGVLIEPAGVRPLSPSAGAILIEDSGRIVAHWNARDATERPLLGAMTAAPGPYRAARRGHRYGGATGRRGSGGRRSSHASRLTVAWLAAAQRLAQRHDDTAASVRRGADGTSRLRHLWRVRRATHLGDTRSVARPRRSTDRQAAALVDTRRQLAGRRHGHRAARRPAARRLRRPRRHRPRGRHDRPGRPHAAKAIGSDRGQTGVRPRALSATAGCVARRKNVGPRRDHALKSPGKSSDP